MHLIEPLGLLYGDDARRAITTGMGWSLAGAEDRAFTFVRFWDKNTASSFGSEMQAVSSLTGLISAEWENAKQKLVRQPPLAGLPPGLLVMGILNVTPDSFSDGGRYFDPEAAIAAMYAMCELGADIIDIGAESTRPESIEVSAEEERARLLPVLKAAQKDNILVSVDTRHAATMALAIEEGAALINDVSALGHDSDSAAIVAKGKKPVVLMHMRGTPQTMATLTGYEGHVAYKVACELAHHIDHACAHGIIPENILVDPGIGFAKNVQENIDLMQHLALLAGLGHRMVLGVSRKSFLGKITGESQPQARDAATLVATLAGFGLKDTICRVHDVKALVQARAVWQSLYGV